MGEAAIPVDLFNPGQVFACLGFLELADLLIGEASAGFEWGGQSSRFVLKSRGGTSAFVAATEFVANAESRWIIPSPNLRERDGGTPVVRPGVSMSLDPKAPDLPGELFLHGLTVPFGFWADGSRRFSTPFKKSTNGASSYVRWENTRRAILELGKPESIASDPLNASCRTESLFRLDPRGYVNPIDAGCSPDKLRKGGIKVRVATYPVCEAMAVIGMTNARPRILTAGSRFGYCVWSSALPPLLARAAVGGRGGPWPQRSFVVDHEEVKRGGDRAITNVYEENGNGQRK